MRACVQRVRRAAVSVKGAVVGQIENGLLVLVAVAESDGDVEVEWMADKLVGLRIFDDAEGKMNVPLAEMGGKMLLVSQFTLLGDCRRGRRPSFTLAATPAKAKAVYEQLVKRVRQRGIEVATGVFQEAMQVELVNDGPVTLVVDR